MIIFTPGFTTETGETVGTSKTCSNERSWKDKYSYSKELSSKTVDEILY